MNVDLPEESVVAPWTHEQVKALAVRQGRRDLHPYTCPADGTRSSIVHREMRVLRATTMGWVCAYHGCEYRQLWAHGADTVDPHPVPAVNADDDLWLQP